MGCASSTPMVATAGSEMLKAATHVREKGEAVVEDASETLTTGLDTAKETVGSAVAGITNELGNAFKEGTQVLDEAKHKVMEGLHLEQPQESKEENTEAEMSSSRAPTPKVEADADSLKTSTPEPEIERALANEEEGSPPSPKPSLEEMAQLSAEVTQAAESTPPAAAPTVDSAPAVVDPPAATEPSAPVENHKIRRRFVDIKDEEQRRPNTTEWEKFADQLAKSKKFKPYESFAHSQNKFSVYQDHTSLRDKPNHTDGHFSDGNSLSSASISDLSSGHVTPAPTRKGHREFAKFVASEQPASVSRSNSRLSNSGASRAFDFNPQRDRITFSMVTNGNRSRIGSGIQRAPVERISGWGRGRPSAVPEVPGYGRRMSTGLIHQPLRPDREKFVPTGRNRAVQPITPVKKTAKVTSSLTTSRESSYLELDKSSKNMPKSKPKETVRSREHSYTDFDSLQVDTTTSSHKPNRLYEDTARISRESTFTDLNSNRSDKEHSAKRDPVTMPSREHSSTDLSSSKNVEKKMLPSREGSYIDFDSKKKIKTPVKNHAMPSRESSQLEFHSRKADKSPLKVETTLVKPILSTGESSFIDFDNSRVSRTPKKVSKPESITHADHLPRRVFSPSPEPESSTNQNLSSMPPTPQKTEAPEAVASTPKMPSPETSRVSSAKSTDSSNLDVVIQPMSKLTTPSIKSYSHSPDQLVLEGYEDSDLEAALARLEILRGSTATLQSLRSCSPGKHTYTASLLSSRRTSPWVMRKNYGGSLAGKENKPTALPGSSSNVTKPNPHPTLERCDICCNEFVLK
ncbi:hypothetical protein KR026_010910 [Drosophila bipectinata]|nr:hypothetical protein KR026_010910 [Drosophila bipectinata]